MLPTNHPQRLSLHGEMHARPHARIRIPALITNVAVLNEGVSLADELAVLRQLPGQAQLSLEALASSFLRVQTEHYIVKWERHGEFTRYSITQPLPVAIAWGAHDPDLAALLPTPAGWLALIPGSTISATQLAMLSTAQTNEADTLKAAAAWLGTEQILAARVGAGFVTAFSDFRLREDNFCRYVTIAQALTPSRAGRVSARLIELEIYRMLALMGFPIARQLGPLLKEAELKLADITADMDTAHSSDSELLHELIALAAKIEGATAAHSFRFSATTAYQNLVQTRLTELNEVRLQGVQTFGEFLNRRFLPAMATVEATHKRLTNLSERIERSSALIRTRADIVREEQNQKLLEKLTHGQRLQLRLQQTVEGLSIVAISYYAISLLGYAFKAGKAAGIPLNTDIATGLSVPLVLLSVGFFVIRLRKLTSAPDT